MHATEKYLHYSVKGTLEVRWEFTVVKSKHKSLHKVAEEHNLKSGKIIYLDLSSQNKPGYGGSKNWILIQDSDTKYKWTFFVKVK